MSDEPDVLGRTCPTHETVLVLRDKALICVECQKEKFNAFIGASVPMIRRPDNDRK